MPREFTKALRMLSLTQRILHLLTPNHIPCFDLNLMALIYLDHNVTLLYQLIRTIPFSLLLPPSFH
jgi:hypothetical protein